MTVLKSTDYCDLLSQARLEEGETVYAIERVYVKKNKQEEIRFCYYKPYQGSPERLVARPLDIREDQLLQLLETAINDDIFSDDFKGKLKSLSQKL